MKPQQPQARRVSKNPQGKVAAAVAPGVQGRAGAAPERSRARCSGQSSQPPAPFSPAGDAQRLCRRAHPRSLRSVLHCNAGADQRQDGALTERAKALANGSHQRSAALWWNSAAHIRAKDEGHKNHAPNPEDGRQNMNPQNDSVQPGIDHRKSPERRVESIWSYGIWLRRSEAVTFISMREDILLLSCHPASSSLRRRIVHEAVKPCQVSRLPPSMLAGGVADKRSRRRTPHPGVAADASSLTFSPSRNT